jgi:hypothetical protein
MSIATHAAQTRFDLALKPAWDLIEIHKRLSADAGRRESELSLNRGAVVFAIAAWQTYVEQVTLAMAVAGAPPVGDPTVRVYSMLKANIENQVRRLNVPNAQKTLDLWSWIAFNPAPAWSFTFSWEKQRSIAHGGAIAHQATLTSQQAKDELDTWVLIRHKIAHGDSLPAEPRFQRLATGERKGLPRIKRADADRCLRFFERLVAITDSEATKAYP